MGCHLSRLIDCRTQTFCEFSLEFCADVLVSLPFFKLVTDGTDQRDIKRQRANIGENRHGRKRFRRVPNPELVKDVRVGERQIGHNKLRQQQPREHRAMNDPARVLFVPTQRFQVRILQSPV